MLLNILEQKQVIQSLASIEQVSFLVLVTLFNG